MAYQVGTIIEATYEYTVNNQKCLAVLHYAPRSVGTADVQVLVQGFLNKFSFLGVGSPLGAFLDLMSVDATILKAHAQAIYPTRWGKLTVNVDTAGTAAGDCRWQQTAIAFTKKGLKGSRHDTGTLHFGGLPEDASTSGLISAGYAAQIGAVANAVKAVIIDTVNSITYDPVILNKTKVVVDGKDKYFISGFTVIADCFAQETTRTMRRRVVGLGI